MEVKILKNVSLFLFFGLMMVATVPGKAQQNERDNHRQIKRGVNQTNSERQGNSSHTRFANQGNNNHTANFRGANRNARVTFGNRAQVSANCRPAIHQPTVIPINQFTYGHRVAFLPQNAVRFRGVNRDYFFARGNFYVQGQRGFRSTQVSLGARVNFLPNRARTVFYGSAVYYKLGNVFLAERIGRRGAAFYEVVGYV